MYNVTQILQSCKEKMRGEMPSESELYHHLNGNYQLCRSFSEAIVDVDQDIIVGIIHELTDLRRIMQFGVYPQAEMLRTFERKISRDDFMFADSRIAATEVMTIPIKRIEPLGTKCVHSKGWMFSAESKPNDKTTVHVAYVGGELTVTPRGLIVLMVAWATARGENCCSRAMQPCYRFAHALYLAMQEHPIQQVCPAGFPITAPQETVPAAPAPVAEEPKVSGTPKSEPAAKHDDSNVIINMTPDLLTMMIKTAVNESVNAVWQKFMENREILMNT